ncbi:ammonium transporter [Humisphaera borealis]|uniref:ammonium transporter n=1 Tax=Humisphaera borealis TaxID=2807512 RepID=UPI0019D0E257|nr:ammonium transporter [Humisphaera borealis]
MAAVLAGSVSAFGADEPATKPSTEPAAAAAAAPVVAAPDPIGFNGGPTNPLLNPNSYLTGWVTGSADKNLDADSGGTFKPWAGDKPTVEELGQHTAKLYYSMNFVWVLISGFLVIFMQAGFALVETGLIRAKNAAHTMSMNFAVYALGMFGFFVCGFAIMCGGWNGTAIGGPGMLGGLPTMNSMFTVGSSVAGDSGWGLFGMKGFCLTGAAYDGAVVVMFLYMMAFMDTTATIVTGACAERWSYKAFCIYSIIIGAFIYPVFACWVWGGGWLAQLGYRAGLGHGVVDFAGSGVVHLQGGALAIITSLLIGPRIGRYTADGKVNPVKPHHIPMVQLGTFILAFGWFGFNAGSTLAASDGRIGMVAVNTMIAGMAATVTGIIYMWVTTGKPDPAMMCNSMLAGLVAITAPCAFVAPWAAFVIGAIAGVLVIWSVNFFDKIRIDDPVGASSVHGVCGAFGVLCVGIFADGTYGNGWNNVGWKEYMGVAGQGVTGLLYGDSKQIIAQIIEVVVCVAWNFIVGGIAFWLVGKLVGNRVSAEVEIAGMDIPEMGAVAYPEFLTPVLPESITPQQVADVRKGVLIV